MSERLVSVAVVGDGASTHAIIDGYARDPEVGKIYQIPGSDMIAPDILDRYGKRVTPLKVAPGDVNGIVNAVKEIRPDYVDFAQEEALVGGAVDRIWNETNSYPIGPSRSAADLEGSKARTRRLAEELNIPQASFRSFDKIEDGIAYLMDQPSSKAFYVKASGLAKGKGALEANNVDEAIERVGQMSQFGESGRTYLIEEWMKNKDGSPGSEFSAFFAMDGEDFQYLGSATDAKRALEGDRGKNTGGMGAYSPTEVVTDDILKKLNSQFVNPILQEMSERGTPYSGILFIGGIVVRDKRILLPKLIEINTRHGNPEATVLIPGIVNFFEIQTAIANGNVGPARVLADGLHRVSITGVSRGYPDDHSVALGREMTGIEKAQRHNGVRIFGGAVAVIDGKHFAKGGRLLNVVGEGETREIARQRAYDAISEINMVVQGQQEFYYREDIAL